MRSPTSLCSASTSKEGPRVRQELPQTRGFDLPDPIAAAVALSLTVATVVKRLRINSETKSEPTRGVTAVDPLRVTGLKPNADVVLEASRKRFLEIFYSSVR